jgi:hypothetical protein
MSERRTPGRKRARVRSPKWPSVKEQIAAAKAVRGSALERLIRHNQDFHLLRPEEATDKLGLPPWLRVYWRKHHAEEKYSAVDPYGEYPDTLGKLHAWMLLHQDLRGNSPRKSKRGSARAAVTDRKGSKR